jgi:hypothetical protein
MATKTKANSTHRISEKLENFIRSRGWAVVSVSGSPGFSYSVGLVERDLAEVIVFGVGGEEGPTIIGDYARATIERGRLKINEPLDGLVKNFRAVLRELAPAEIQQYLKAAWVRSGGTMDAVQLVWPDPSGKFPWEGGFDRKFLPYQPLLGAHPLVPAAN